jgi:hypothetical protein
MKAFKLLNTNGSDCSFLEGEVPSLRHIDSSYFFVQNHMDACELVPHSAPRYQLVVTLKGKLKFTVTNGDSFIIEPGVLLIAADLNGKGHSWELIEGPEWLRIYIVLKPGADDGFRPL